MVRRDFGSRKKCEIDFLNLSVDCSSDDMIHWSKPSSPLKGPSVQWTAAVALLMLVFLALNSVPGLRPFWQLLDAGLSANQPTIDLGSLLAGVDSFRAAGFQLDIPSMQKAIIARDLPPFNFPYIWLWLAYVPG